jgi:carbon monoxide dehydrogenase subunit G
VAEYRLLTIWRFDAPLDEVFNAIQDSLRWPQWWPGVQSVEQTDAGDEHGIDNLRRYVWKGALPYRIKFEVRTTRNEKEVAIEGSVKGDLEGFGNWHFCRQGTVSVVRYEWHVRSTRWWMNMSAPLARSVFIRNHALVMEQGGIGLARRLGTRLLMQEHIDLLTTSTDRRQSGCRERRRIDLAMVLAVGMVAGITATGAQLALWWLTQRPLLETLLRDTRMTAALLMGSGILPPPYTARADILVVATLIHFALSAGYALLPTLLPWQLDRSWLVVGIVYGFAIYGINLYGFTLLFPWFTVARDSATLMAHLVFGVTLTAGFRFALRRGRIDSGGPTKLS